MGFPEQWTKHEGIIITGGSSGAQTNFQLKLQIAHDPDMRADFGDLRFTEADGVTLIPMWLEEKTDGVSATVWVKFPTTPANGAKMSYYMHYGNPSASSASNGIATFAFFDDFEDGNIDGWTPACEAGCGSCLAYAADTTYSVSGLYSLYLYGKATCKLAPYCGVVVTVSRTLALADGSYKLEFYERGWGGQYGFCSGGHAGLNYACADSIRIYNAGNTCPFTGCNKCSTQWKLASSDAFTVSGGSTTIKLQTHASDCTEMKGWFDDVRVRKYVANPPTYAFGSLARHHRVTGGLTHRPTR